MKYQSKSWCTAEMRNLKSNVLSKGYGSSDEGNTNLCSLFLQNYFEKRISIVFCFFAKNSAATRYLFTNR